MITTVLQVTNKNGTTERVVTGKTIDEAKHNIERVFVELFGKGGGNNRELKAVTTLVTLWPNEIDFYTVSMQLCWNNLWKLWEIQMEDWVELTERFTSFEAAIEKFCWSVLPTE